MNRPDLSAGACRGTSPVFFYPNSPNDDTTIAKRICRTCPVLTLCRDWALNLPELDGVWGGLTATERTQWRRVQRVVDT